MKKRKILPVLRHAVQMVGRTWKSYALLSVTIVLSFSLLLGYLVFSDSAIYNQYKELFSYRRQDVRVSLSNGDEKLSLLLENLESMEDTGYFVAQNYKLGEMSTDYQMELHPAVEGLEIICFDEINATMVPDHCWIEGQSSVIVPGRCDIVWLDGQNHTDFVLEKDQVIVTEAIYRIMQMDQQEAPVLQLNCLYGQKIPLKVVGYTTDESYEYWKSTAHYITNSVNTYSADLNIILSTKFIDYAHLDDDTYWQRTSYRNYPKYTGTLIYICSQTPEQVVSLLETMDISTYSCVYQQQNAALDAIRPEKEVKAIITCALLLLLGINLYSSFTNAMNDRKYEIGIKRAIGASGWSIIRQFLYESTVVMLVNILVSIVLVADVTIVYKYIVEHTPNAYGYYEDYILYVSEYSIGMFLVCAVSLTVVFSLIFAYKSTRVEIVQYLKAE